MTPQSTTRAFGREAAEHRVEDRAADVVEVHVDAPRAVLSERCRQVVLAVVDAGVETELVDHHAAFLGTAGDADHPGAGDLGDLAGDRTGGTRRGRHHHCLAGLGLADARHAEVGRGSRGPVHRHHRQLTQARSDGRTEHVVANEDEILEARQCRHHVAHGKSVATRFHDLTDPGGPDDLAQLHRREVTGLVVQPGPYGGIHPDVGGAQQRLPHRGLWRR